VLIARVLETNLETDMKTIVLVLSLIALAAPAQAAQKTQSRHDSQSLEQKCRQMVGKEQYEGEGRSHMGHAGAALQRLHDRHAELISRRGRAAHARASSERPSVAGGARRPYRLRPCLFA
jgi:hypothetical protein